MTSTSSLERASRTTTTAPTSISTRPMAMRRDSPVVAENFMAGLGEPDIAGQDATGFRTSPLADQVEQ